MVALKNLFLLGAAAASVFAAPAANPVTLENGVEAVEPKPLEARVNGRMTLQRSLGGQFLFLLGGELPAAVLQSFYALGPAGPARALLNEFSIWLHQAGPNYNIALNALNGNTARVGGVVGKGIQDAVGNLYGFGIYFTNYPGMGVVANIEDAIVEWASKDGGLIQTIGRPNNFYDPNMIGAGGTKKRDTELEERSRTDTCPADTNILKYANFDVPDNLDINKNIRWGGICPKD
ncbi:MAG: hypothetical protein Q9222_004317 [Ikaeria aurantiellina]